MPPGSSSRSFSCPRCGSTRIRRSLPQDGWERLVRELTPIHYFRCRDCNHRGSHWGAIAWPERELAADLPTRPAEQRDVTAVAVQRRRVVLLVLIAIGGGVVTGFMVHSCAPPPAVVAP